MINRLSISERAKDLKFPEFRVDIERENIVKRIFVRRKRGETGMECVWMGIRIGICQWWPTRDRVGVLGKER